MMELNNQKVKVELDMETVTGSERELERYRSKWKELEERGEKFLREIKKGISEFESLVTKFSLVETEKKGMVNDFENLKQANVELEKKIGEIRNRKGEKGVVDLSGDEEDEVAWLTIENKVLECEKKAAEGMVEDLKAKCLRLEMENSALKEGKVLSDKNFTPGIDSKTSTGNLKHEMAYVVGIGDSKEAAATPSNNMGSNQYTQDEETGFPFKAATRSGRRVRKQLTFVEASASKKMAPSTPGVKRPYPHNIVDISDSGVDQEHITNVSNSRFALARKKRRASNIVNSDSESIDEDDNIPIGNLKNKHLQGESKDDIHDIPSTPGVKRPYPHSIMDISDSEDDQEHITNVHTSPFGSSRNNIGHEDGANNSSPFASARKKRRTSNIINSDSESIDEDDNIPIGNLKNKHLQGESNDDIHDFDLNDVVEEPSSPRRRLVRKCDRNLRKRSYPRHEDVEVDEEETSSSSGNESLTGFIVSDDDISESDDGCSSVSREVSDDDMDYSEVISKIRRKRDKKVKWEFEADMLADFGKDVELCMKAVCALYRQQTSEEKCSKGSIYLNRRGFSHYDAPRGTILAEYLCDGDPQGDVCKSVEELQEYNPKGPELCRTLATRYSKQLFVIYQNKEDPLFLPS